MLEDLLVTSLVVYVLKSCFNAIFSPDDLKLVEFRNVFNECTQNILEIRVTSKLATTSDLRSARWTFFLINSVIVLNAPQAELMQTLLNVERVVKDVRTQDTSQVLLQLVEKINIDFFFIIADLDLLAFLLSVLKQLKSSLQLVLCDL